MLRRIGRFIARSNARVVSAPTKLLQEDGTSSFLLEDGTSRLLLEA